MSLLMLIKYPVSNPPSLNQIQTLPRELYNEWLSRMGFNDVTQRLPLDVLVKVIDRLHGQGNYSAYEKLFHLIYMLDENE